MKNKHKIYFPNSYLFHLLWLIVLISCGGNSNETRAAQSFLESLGAVDSLGRHVEAMEYVCDANKDDLINDLAVRLPDLGAIDSVRCQDEGSDVMCTFTAPVFCVDDPDDPDSDKLLCSIEPEGHELKMIFEMSESQVCDMREIDAQ